MSNSCAAACCPCQNVYLQKNEHAVIKSDVSQWLAKNKGYTLSTSPLPMPTIVNINGGAAPLPNEIEISDWNGNVGNKAYVNPQDNTIGLWVKAGSTSLGKQYRVDFEVTAKGCGENQPPIKIGVCLIISVVEC